MSTFRLIPSIESVLQQPALAPRIAEFGREAVAEAARRAADDLRARIQAGASDIPGTPEDASTWLAARVGEELNQRFAFSLRPVLNATGVIIHTNLGRAPLAREALERAIAIGRGYSNLEYDLAAGDRGHRHVHAERLLCQLTGAEAALVVNNNAAATLLVLAALAAGREVLVSRGELVEIGGGFRVPDVMAQSGAVLREVGTTNRTRVGDYAAAISPRTALILRVHPSNFRIEGFTERPALGELSALAHRFTVPLFEDLGSGWLGLKELDSARRSLGDEPSAAASLEAGADLVAFSGDKLLGGPQAGIILGRQALIDRVGRHPLMRAVRADKLTYAALEATLALWSKGPARPHIPIYRLLTMPVETIGHRVDALIAQLRDARGLTCRVLDGVSTTGGGSAPASALPTRLIALNVDGISASALEARLRHGNPPVIARIQDDEVVLDLRTVLEEQDADLLHAIRSVC